MQNIRHLIRSDSALEGAALRHRRVTLSPAGQPMHGTRMEDDVTQAVLKLHQRNFNSHASSSAGLLLPWQSHAAPAVLK